MLLQDWMIFFVPIFEYLSLLFSGNDPVEDIAKQKNKGASSEIGKLTHIIQINNAATEGMPI